MEGLMGASKLWSDLGLLFRHSAQWKRENTDQSSLCEQEQARIVDRDLWWKNGKTKVLVTISQLRAGEGVDFFIQVQTYQKC